ncbi:MAG: hypothetical protein EA422_09740 [Gemmatimonadales bacterium]|nr:MAG: hypothetical protein EA422_09740 [Gemmatimonadales bacterium]
MRLDDLLALVPHGGGLEPLRALLIAASRPDALHRWSASAEVGTLGSRRVDVDTVRARLPDMLRQEARRREEEAGRVVELARSLERGGGEATIDLLLTAAATAEGEGRLSTAESWALAAWTTARTLGDPRVAEARRVAARCARHGGRLGDSAAWYEEAHREALDHGRLHDAVVAATGRGNVAVDRGRWTEAGRWYRTAMEIVDGRTGDGESVDARMGGAAPGHRWRLFQNLAITAREEGHLEEAERYLRKAEVSARTARTPGRDHDPSADAALVELANGWGQLSLARGEAEVAERHFRRALAALDDKAAHEAQVVLRVNLGEALLARGHLLDAGIQGRDAEARALRHHLHRRLPEVYRLLARVARRRGEQEAFVLLDRALHIIRELRLPPYEEALTLQEYARIRAWDGALDEAAAARTEAERLLRGAASPGDITHDETGP